MKPLLLCVLTPVGPKIQASQVIYEYLATFLLLKGLAGISICLSKVQLEVDLLPLCY